MILAGFTVGIWSWHRALGWLFRIPPLLTASSRSCLRFRKQTPEAAGSRGVIHMRRNDGDKVTVSLRESFVTIFIIHLSGSTLSPTPVREPFETVPTAGYSLLCRAIKLNMEAKPAAVFCTMNLMPLVAVGASFAAGIIPTRSQWTSLAGRYGTLFLETIVT